MNAVTRSPSQSRDLHLQVRQLDLPRHFDPGAEQAPEQIEPGVRSLEIALPGRSFRAEFRGHQRVEAGHVQQVDLVQIGVHLTPAAELPELLANHGELLRNRRDG